MRFLDSRHLLFALLFLAVPSAARAETIVAPCVEWLVCSSELIVSGKLSKIMSSPGPGSVTYEECIVTVDRIFKGKIEGKEVSFILRRVGESPTARPLLKSKEGVLLFLSRSKDHGPEKYLDGKWVPSAPPEAPPIHDLDGPVEGLYSRQMRAVTRQEQLVEIIQGWAKSPLRHSIRIEVPFDSPLFSKLWAGSAVYLIVPAEPRLREEFLRWAASPDANKRARAAGELWKFPGKETEAVLRKLLDDDSEHTWNYAQDQIAKVEYHVRSAAWHSLKTLELPVPDLPLERKPTAQEQRQLRTKVWTDSFSTALKDGWVISVADGPSRVLDSREQFIVLVTCRRGKDEATFRLVPREWPATELPKSRYLGTNGRSSQGARRFYLEGALPAEVVRQVEAYFGLEN